jgi:hypothetical protein
MIENILYSSNCFNNNNTKVKYTDVLRSGFNFFPERTIRVAGCDGDDSEEEIGSSSAFQRGPKGKLQSTK